nr:ATP-dependent RNA helicase HrpA [Planctomycetota bacterium]
PEPDAEGEIDWPAAVHSGLLEVFDEGPGDVLVFLPGERQIRETADYLRKRMDDVELVPLFARLSARDQQRVFAPHGGRRVVLATNVAETSLTVPGIRYVVDPGLARINRYSNRRRVQRLPIEHISQASAAQRAGRCGRVADGICIRLYTEREFGKRDTFTAPQILRSNLAAVILQMKALGLGDVEAFPFIDPPKPGMIRDGYLTLYELGAVQDDGELTDRGWALARLPIDPRLGRMLQEADERGCLAEMLVITAALSVREPRERPPDARDDADRAHLRFRHPDSDFLSYGKLWRAFQKQRKELGSSKLRRWCRNNHLSFARMREWGDVWRQLTELVREAGLQPNESPAPSTAVHRAVIAGLLINVGHRTEKYAYRGANASKLWLWPGSALAEVRPSWIVAAERVETTRLFARTVGPIDPKWIEPLAEHLVDREYYDPHWNGKQAHVYAYEKVSLFGIEIVSKRRVHYAPVNLRRAREIFIRHALVHGRWRTRARFFRDNQALLEEVRGMEARARRTGLMADADDRFAFYDERVPADVASGPALEKWVRHAEKTTPRVLHMQLEDLLVDPAKVPVEERFPDTIDIAGLRLAVRYRFEPGHVADGVTLTVPLEALGQVDPERLDWLVPGYLHEKVVALLRTLPKERRRPLVPLPETADRMLEHMDFGRGSLFEALSMALERMGQPRIPVTAWKREGLPPFLRMNLRVVDAQGKPIGHGRSLAALRAELFAEMEETAAKGLDERIEQTGLRAWDVGTMPERVAVARGSYTVHGYPALVDEGESVALRVVDTPERARRLHRRGVIRLLAIALSKPLAACVRGVDDVQRMRLWYGTLPVSTPLDRLLADRIVARAAGVDVAAIRTVEAFEAAVGAARRGLSTAANEVGRLAHDILGRYHDVASKLMLTPPPPYKPSMDDMIGHLALLLDGEFLIDTPWEWLTEMPRFLDALDLRLVRIGQGGLAKDRDLMQRIAKHTTRLTKREARLRKEGIHDDELERYRWMIEELRVSLWAQELGTRMPISEKRLDAQWGKVRA